MKVGLCIPTRNPGAFANQQASSIARQSLQPDVVLVIDSSSTDGSLDAYRNIGARVDTIDAATFNHGGTRQKGAELLDAEVIVFLTQDAILATPDSLQKLVASFDDLSVGAAYGRQLARTGAGPIEVHARLFNYPAQGRTKSLEDKKALGIKTVFASNSFAAYRRADLMQIGGFPSKLIMGEDSYVVAKMLLAGKKIGYCAEATVFHSHDYSFAEEFRRYFDTGVFHARESWIRENFGYPQGEGVRYVKSELRYLAKENPFLIPSALVRNGLKLGAFKLGLLEARLPTFIKRRISMMRSYWPDQ